MGIREELFEMHRNRLKGESDFNEIKAVSKPKRILG